MSDEQIAKGSRWSLALGEELEAASFGIVCLTPNNLLSPWLLFEVGALSKDLRASRVSPLLFGIEPSDVPDGPLGLFQMTRCNSRDLRRLVRAVNEARPVPLKSTTLDRSFDAWWPELEATFEQIRATYGGVRRTRLWSGEVIHERERLLAMRAAFKDVMASDWVSINVAAFDQHLDYALRATAPESKVYGYEQYISSLVVNVAQFVQSVMEIFELLSETDREREHIERIWKEWDELADLVIREIPYQRPEK